MLTSRMTRRTARRWGHTSTPPSQGTGREEDSRRVGDSALVFKVLFFWGVEGVHREQNVKRRKYFGRVGVHSELNMTGLREGLVHSELNIIG